MKLYNYIMIHNPLFNNRMFCVRSISDEIFSLFWFSLLLALLRLLLLLLDVKRQPAMFQGDWSNSLFLEVSVQIFWQAHPVAVRSQGYTRRQSWSANENGMEKENKRPRKQRRLLRRRRVLISVTNPASRIFPHRLNWRGTSKQSEKTSCDFVSQRLIRCWIGRACFGLSAVFWFNSLLYVSIWKCKRSYDLFSSLLPWKSRGSQVTKSRRLRLDVKIRILFGDKNETPLAVE